MRNLILLLAAMAFAGCSTLEQQHEHERQEQLNANLQSWVGQDVNRLIEAKGPPQGTYKMPNGNVIYTFAKESAPITTVMNYGRMPMAITNTFHCRIDITTGPDNVIRTWNYEGNNCY